MSFFFLRFNNHLADYGLKRRIACELAVKYQLTQVPLAIREENRDRELFIPWKCIYRDREARPLQGALCRRYGQILGARFFSDRFFSPRASPSVVPRVGRTQLGSPFGGQGLPCRLPTACRTYIKCATTRHHRRHRAGARIARRYVACFRFRKKSCDMRCVM